MRLKVLLVFLTAASLATAWPQSNRQVPRPNLSPSSFFRSVSALFARRWSSHEELQRSADALAVRYRSYVKQVRKEADSTIREVESRLNELDFKEKCNLALELWRVHSSLNLLALLSKDALAMLTGMTVADTQELRSRLERAEQRFQRQIPGF